jgi:hypothetical protein
MEHIIEVIRATTIVEGNLGQSESKKANNKLIHSHTAMAIAHPI